jgi:putative ABC transport system permease protein
MFLRLLYESFRRQRRRKLLAGAAILLGTTAVTAMLALATTIGDRIHQELAVYGANIVVTPVADSLDVKVGGVNLKPANGGAYLHEKDLEKLHGIFWANNITGVSPELREDGTVRVPDSSERDTRPDPPRFVWVNDRLNESQRGTLPVGFVGYWFQHRFGNIVTGAPQLHPWWKIEGRWPYEHNITPHHGEFAIEVVVGATLAQRFGLKVGDWISLGSETEADVVGIVHSGDAAEQQMLYALDAIQPVPALDAHGKPLDEAPIDVSRVEISARTKPEDAFARSDPDKLTGKKHDLWYCSPYANSIAYQIREAIPGANAQQVRQVEQSEGTVLSRISGLMWLISAAALLAAGFAVSAAMATAILERRAEIGLMRSLGASRSAIALLFYSETGILAIVAGACGYLLGSSLAAYLGAKIFATGTTTLASIHLATVLNPVLLPIVVGLALVVAIAGSTPSIRAALRMDPSSILRASA